MRGAGADERGGARRAAGVAGVALVAGMLSFVMPAAALLAGVLAVGAVGAAVRRRDDARHGELAAAVAMAAGAVLLAAMALLGAMLQPHLGDLVERTMREEVAPAVEREHGDRLLADVRDALGPDCAERIAAVAVRDAHADAEGRLPAGSVEQVVRVGGVVTVDGRPIEVTLLRTQDAERRWVVTDGMADLADACG